MGRETAVLGADACSKVAEGPKKQLRATPANTAQAKTPMNNGMNVFIGTM
jgi:hypothetical protein